VIYHSNHAAQYTSLAFIRRLVQAGGASRPRTLAEQERPDDSSLQLHWGLVNQQRQTADRLIFGGAWQDRSNLVFTARRGLPLNQRVLLEQSFYPLLVRAGVPRVRFHDLRHTCATLPLAAGEHLKIVQELLGHAYDSVEVYLREYARVVTRANEPAVC
jgi:integrase